MNLCKQTVIPHQHYGQRVDVVLAQLFPDYSRSQLSQWLKIGAITLNQQSYQPKDKVYGGEIVALQLQTSIENQAPEAENIPLQIVYEDEDVLVINKPAGLIVHPGAGNPRHTLVNALLHYAPPLNALPRAGIVHRLDKDTTGLLIIAKTHASHTHLIRQMQAREIQRRYVTLVHQQVMAGGIIETAFGRHPHQRLKMAVRPSGKIAITHYAVRRRYPMFTLLDVKLLTGRTHQIRVHLAHLQHPVVGDQLYGAHRNYSVDLPVPLRDALQQFKRQALHACALTFLHPISQVELTFTAPIPDDFQSILTLMDTYLE